ncbi:hypothetical protein FRC08_005061 [Ceratobasidium sp. 394]|nr:hypothetical protein FRC08_005061 [Ceratobasidium sp. 394]
MTQLDPDGVERLKRDLADIKIAFEEACSPGRVSFGRVKPNLEAVEDLERQIDTLIKLTELQLVLAQRDDTLKTIEEYKIDDQKIVPRTPIPWWYRQKPIRPQSVTTCYRLGRVGKLPVVYVTYSSTNTTHTDKRIRQVLDLYSQCLHPNVAIVAGVTRGPRLNGVVFTSATLPYEEFLRQVSSPAVLARCVREFEASSTYF